MKHTRTWPPTADVITAVDGVTPQRSAAATLHVATAQIITGQVTISTAWCGAWQSMDAYAVILLRSTPTAKEITLRSATDVRR